MVYITFRNMECYFDNSATTRVHPEVADTIHKVMLEEYGNPSSMHKKGMEAEMIVRNARETIASTLKVDDRCILFTSGGTESDNMALIGCCDAYKRQGKHIITTKIEHPAILDTCKYLEENRELLEPEYLKFDNLLYKELLNV